VECSVCIGCIVCRGTTVVVTSAVTITVPNQYTYQYSYHCNYSVIDDLIATGLSTLAIYLNDHYSEYGLINNLDHCEILLTQQWYFIGSGPIINVRLNR
jgi:hypothetical protein